MGVCESVDTATNAMSTSEARKQGVRAELLPSTVRSVLSGWHAAEGAGVQSHGSAAFRGTSLAFIISQTMSGHTGHGAFQVAARVRACADGVA